MSYCADASRKSSASPPLGRVPRSRLSRSAFGAGARRALTGQTRALRCLLGEARFHQQQHRIGLGDRVVGAIVMRRQSDNEDHLLSRLDCGNNLFLRDTPQLSTSVGASNALNNSRLGQATAKIFFVVAVSDLRRTSRFAVRAPTTNVNTQTCKSQKL
jgi:hypothetical protein